MSDPSQQTVRQLRESVREWFADIDEMRLQIAALPERDK